MSALTERVHAPSASFAPPASSIPTPPYPGASTWTKVSQGSESTIFLLPHNALVTGHPLSSICKHRFPKLYRHPTLNKQLTSSRLKGEVRCLTKARRGGVQTPEVLGVDERNGCIFLAYLSGGTVRDRLRSIYNEQKGSTKGHEQKGNEQKGNEQKETPAVGNSSDVYGAAGAAVATAIGRLVVDLHATNIVHGDLTTSNLMFSAADVPTLIDFGLACVSTSNEDRAVDLYVLERAIASTHPHSESIVKTVMSVYKNQSKHGDKVMQKLAEVRARGRKRECFG